MEKIKEVEQLVGKWIEEENHELPVWANGDPWKSRIFVWGTHYHKDENGKLRVSICVMYGFEARKTMEKHGGTLDISRLTYTGTINDVAVVDGRVGWAYGLREHGELGYPHKILDDQPEWFSFITGQMALFQ